MQAATVCATKDVKSVILTQTNVIRHLTKWEYFQLRELCFFSNCLYNFGLYNVRQQFFADKTFLYYTKNESLCKENDNYKLLQANVAQQTLRDVDDAFKSFFGSLKSKKITKAQPPKYREKGGLYTLTISGNSIHIKDGHLVLPLSKTYSKVLGEHRIKIKFPERLVGKKIKEVRIVPYYGGKYFKVAYCYEIDKENLNLNRENSLAIDIGLDNLATCVTNAGTSFIMDGRKIKHINQRWNKRKAYLQAILSRQNRQQHFSELLRRITIKRNNRINDCLKKTVRYIINFCIVNDIGTLICGYNSDFKRGINLGKTTNQNFTQINFGALRAQLKYLCQRYGMKYVEQEESYTSKASFLDLDELPTYDAEKPYTGTFSGKRIKRGLYKSAGGRLINADVNGAANILRKSKQNFKFEELCAGLLASPLRIRTV
ncbi:MAG: transposase [Selenomonadaceae bacterium]|nr:transposase [Selenomonadaceae bacterium]